MGENDGQGQKAQIQRTHERCNGDPSTVSNSRIRRPGKVLKSGRTIGTDSENWTRGTLVRIAAGGVIAQLIQDVEDQLGESQETIARESRKIEKLNQRLITLRRLQESQIIED